MRRGCPENGAQRKIRLTTGRNFVMSCVNRAFSLTGKILTKGLVALKRHFVLLCARRSFAVTWFFFCDPFWCHFLIFVDSGCSFCWLHFPWFILYRENVLGGTECACWCVLFRENVLCGTKNSFARKRWGILRLWGHLGHSGALWWFHNPKC